MQARRQVRLASFETIDVPTMPVALSIWSLGSAWSLSIAMSHLSLGMLGLTRSSSRTFGWNVFAAIRLGD